MVREVRVSWDSDEELSGVSFRWGDRMTGIEDDWDEEATPITIPLRQTSLQSPGESPQSSTRSTRSASRRRTKKSRRSTRSNDDTAESTPKRNLADANWLAWGSVEPLKPPKHPGRTPNRDTGPERG